MNIGPAIRGRYWSCILVMAGLFGFLGSASGARAAGGGAIDLIKQGVVNAAKKAGIPGADKDTAVDAPYVGTVVGNILNPLLALLGTVFAVMVIYAGIQWMLAVGNEEKVTASRNTIIHGAIGLAIVGGAYVILNFVVNILVGAFG